MTHSTNPFGQPVGAALPEWRESPAPPRTPMRGETCSLELLDVRRHGDPLARALVAESPEETWTYLPYGPFETGAEMREFLGAYEGGRDPLMYSIVAPDGTALGLSAYLAIRPAHGVLEIGHVLFSAELQRTRMASEAMYLMMARAFDELGARRYEWKCDALNAGSRRAAERLGFTLEGVFRNHWVYKGRSRDTAWFSILDSEWPHVKRAFAEWLDPSNFDDEGRQKRPLRAARARASTPGVPGATSQSSRS